MKNKVILVTGGSSGIGLSICNKLADTGYIVYGTSRNSRNESHNGYKLVNLDVEDETSIIKCIENIIEKEGRIDVIINNAGLGIMGAVEDCNDAEIAKAFNVNVFGLVRVTRTVLPYMRAQKSGLIINIASIAGHMGLPYRGFYSASKAAVHRITESLRLEVRNFGVKACIIDPGDFNTNISNNRVVSNNILKGSVYADETKRIEAMINSEINKSLDAEIIGNLVLKILNTPEPKTYYRIGKISQKLSVKIRTVFGADLFEKILRKFYKLP